MSDQLAGSPRLQKAVNNAPAIHFGESNEGVAAMQRGLIDLGYPMPKSTGNGAKPPDGIYGAETAAALKRFQQDQKLVVDAAAGANTLTRMDELLLSQTTYNAAAENAAIVAAQMGWPKSSRPFAATTARKS
jgi:peptidoglycan hydrolase-like protein with peptidoglycan-binding domain